jgi:hypothetical protein
MFNPNPDPSPMSSFADRIIHFNSTLNPNLSLPEGIAIMNPFRDNPRALEISSQFYRKFYSDNKTRRLILGINPGRFGAGVTGIPFTDTKRLAEKCGLHIENLKTHEPSSVFVYEVIDAYGGPERFYGDFYINSPCPLGFIKATEKGKAVNYNYYDSKALTLAVYPFMIESVKAHIALGIDTRVAFCLGSGKNYQVLSRMNEEHGFFDRLIPLEHPRFIMQYRSKQKAAVH